MYRDFICAKFSTNLMRSAQQERENDEDLHSLPRRVKMKNKSSSVRWEFVDEMTTSDLVCFIFHFCTYTGMLYLVSV